MTTVRWWAQTMWTQPQPRCRVFELIEVSRGSKSVDGRIVFTSTSPRSVGRVDTTTPGRWVAYDAHGAELGAGSFDDAIALVEAVCER